MPANARVLQVVAVAKTERAKAVTRKAYSDEVIAEVTRSARCVGPRSLWWPVAGRLVGKITT